MTYKQAQFEGGQVRGGQRGSMVVFRSPFEIVEKNAKGEEASKTIQILKRYTVFNVEQIDGLPEKFRPKLAVVLSPNERITTAEAFVKATAAVVQHGGGEAYYSPPKDIIQMPPFERFEEAESYYATLLHELTHWTRPQNRLNRDFGQQKRGDISYATEELVAEICAAFLCAELGITPEIREDHAAYIGHWLSILKEDNRAIFRAAAHAQRAADYLKGLQPHQPEPKAVDQVAPADKSALEEESQRAPAPTKKPRRQKCRAAKSPTPSPH
jgi:antirestriction protein ArdC